MPGVITRREHLPQTSKTPPLRDFNHQQKCLINGICGIFDMKSNHVGKVIPKKPKNFTKIG